MVPYTTEELTALHKAALMDTVALFSGTPASDAAFVRHLRIAAREISRCKRPRTMLASLALVEGQASYDAPADLLAVKVADWGVAAQHSAPWNGPRTPLPSLARVEDPATGEIKVRLSPPPTCAQLTAYGSDYSYYYMAAHLVPDTGSSTITDRELDLLLLRAKVEAMRELSIRNHNKPVTLRAGSGMGDAVMAKNMTPPALYDAFLREYNEAA